MTATRRRGQELDDAILGAAWETLTHEGYPGFTYEAVSERARTSKAVLYRRWGDKESLLLATLSYHLNQNVSEVPDTGTVRGDVLALLRSFNSRLGEGIAALLSAILSAYFDEIATTPAQLRERVLGDRAVAMTQIVERAVARGEIASPPPQRVVMLPYDLVRHELVMTMAFVPDKTIVDIVDTIFLPLVGLSAHEGRG